MANLNEVAELAWRQLYPNPSDETAITREEFIATAKYEFSYQTLLMAWKMRLDEGFFLVPDYLSTEVIKDVVNNEIDISDLGVMNALPSSVWLQNIGGLTCKCRYVKSTVNLAQLLCDDDSLGDTVKTYLVVGKKIRFPLGTHTTPLPIIYANNGFGLDGLTFVDEAIAGIVRSRLVEIYGGKTGAEDETNDSNSQESQLKTK